MPPFLGTHINISPGKIHVLSKKSMQEHNLRITTLQAKHWGHQLPYEQKVLEDIAFQHRAALRNSQCGWYDIP